ncbi:phosducin-like protein 3 isoform X2 [Dreissena polymorpha]|uniref:phosducin-like protein 3 isoform X2 n=1 Tax=Dreissena polymorpha TaxID=45954 RepID=UPI0022651325|nr:phosducin-like protein 3 isoform X2 [Dreissena polymorpha]
MDPNLDTEWNDVLRAKGILPPKEEKEITEEDLIKMVESTIENKSKGRNMGEMSLDDLNELEDNVDEEEERIFEQYRRQRLAEMHAAQQRSKFGEVREISKSDWVTEVNKAGEGIWVVIHVYKEGIPLCKLLNQHLSNLAQKFPETKFLRSVSSLCIPNYPDKNLPTIFVYKEGEMKKQFVGPLAFGGMNLKKDELEWMLSQTGAINTDLEEAPRPEVKDVMNIAIRDSAINRGDDDDDDY